jgi:NAD(P)-dependent dehydrogenase (short-subunit alcohol dehydrogenase family)
MNSTIALHTVKPSITYQLGPVIVLGASHQIGTSLSHLLLRANVKVIGSARAAEHSRQLWELSDDFPQGFAPISVDLLAPPAQLPYADALVVVIPRSLGYELNALNALAGQFSGPKLCIHPNLAGNFFASAAAQKIEWQHWRTIPYPDDLPSQPARELFAVVDRAFTVLKGDPACS